MWEHDYSAYDTDVYLYAGGETGTVGLGTSIYDEINPEIAGDQVTWQAWDGNDWEVYSAEITV